MHNRNVSSSKVGNIAKVDSNAGSAAYLPLSAKSSGAKLPSTLFTASRTESQLSYTVMDREYQPPSTIESGMTQ
jgi:hypothetical protein